MSTVVKTLLVLLWLVFLACIGALGLFIAYFMGIYSFPLPGPRWRSFWPGFACCSGSCAASAPQSGISSAPQALFSP